MFKRVRVAVENETNGEQTPWESSTVTGDFYLIAKAREAPAPAEVPGTVPQMVSAD